jgi:hypothetical protein
LGEEISLISNPPPKVKGSNPFSPVKGIEDYKEFGLTAKLLAE